MGILVFIVLCYISYLCAVYYRIQLLESKLPSRRKVEHEETAHLEKAMEQVEDNLKRSTVRTKLCLYLLLLTNFRNRPVLVYREEQSMQKALLHH